MAPRLSWLPAIWLALGCTDKTSGDSGEAVAPGIALAPENNYTFSGTIDVPAIATAPEIDLEICWEDLTSDLQCHETSPTTDIDNVALIRLDHLSQAEVSQGLSGAGLQQADISGYVEYNTADGETCASFSQMSFFGSDVDVPSEYTTAGSTYLLLLATGTEPGVGARALVFLEPTKGSKVTRIDVGDACGILELTVDLQSLTPLSLPAAGPWEVNWASLETDGQGLAFDPSDIDEVWVARYAGMTPADLEANFLDLEQLATDLYTLPITAGSSADLAQATTAAGATFSGFDAADTWILALRCSRCQNPAPLFLTILSPS